MKILAIDPAASTGWAWSDGQRLLSGVWRLAARGEDVAGRLARLESNLHDLLAEHGAEVIAYELATFGSRHAHVQRMHNELAGVVELVASRRGIPTWKFQPSAWKKRAVGKGNADKEGVRRGLKLFYQITVDVGDEADAVGILMAAKQGPPSAPAKKQAKRVKKTLAKKQKSLFR